jgi:hypothetical protein
MELKSRLFPYPVLSRYSDDFTSVEFDIDVIPEIGRRTIKFSFFVKLDDDVLLNMIERNQAEFAVHVECPSTCHRELITFREMTAEQEIESGKLNGTVQFCPFILSSKDVDDYSSPNFNSVYKNMKFFIEKHNILAFGKQSNVPVEKDYDDIKNVTSIFTIIPNYDVNAKTIIEDLTGEKILIKIPKKQFDKYKVVSGSPMNTPIFHSLLILPILVEVFELLKKDGLDDFDDLRWFKSLKKAFSKKGIEFSKDNIEYFESFKNAQLILDSPIIASFDNMFEMSGIGLGDEDEA